MNKLAVRLHLDSDAHQYHPGEEITGRFFVEDAHRPTVRAAELSVLWYTAGKGEEDLAVHFFERYHGDTQARLDLRTPRRFAVRLPLSPLSYDGIILKVCWCIRLRLFLERGQEVVQEVPFRIGNVRPPH